MGPAGAVETQEGEEGTEGVPAGRREERREPRGLGEELRAVREEMYAALSPEPQKAVDYINSAQNPYARVLSCVNAF